MFRNEKLELKVGLFMGVGIFLMFLIVFSISDFYFLKEGYDIKVVFDTAGGITENAPVRFTGVHVGEIKSAGIFQDEAEGKPRVKLNVRIAGDINIPEDAVARINTLGILGEQYLEITPGFSKRYLQSGGLIVGKNPTDVGQQMEKMSEFMASATGIMERIENGEGTLGKLLLDNDLYEDIKVIFDRLRNGEGTLGKFLVKDDVYDNVEDFTSDIKQHPWKLLHKTSDRAVKKKKKQ